MHIVSPSRTKGILLHHDKQINRVQGFSDMPQALAGKSHHLETNRQKEPTIKFQVNQNTVQQCLQENNHFQGKVTVPN